MAQSDVVAQMLRFKKLVEKRDQVTLLRLGHKWLDIRLRLFEDAQKLAAEIERIKREGGVVSPYRVWQLERYQKYIETLGEEADRFARGAVGTLNSGVRDLSRMGLEQSGDLLRTSGVTSSFNTLNVEASQSMVALVNTDQLRGVMHDVTNKPRFQQALMDELVRGITIGESPYSVASQMADLIGRQYLGRMMRIARTEQMRAYRESSIQQYEASGVVEGFYRLASKSARSCIACLLADGEFYALKDGDRLWEHPQGRCLMIPKIMGQKKPEWEKGYQWFERQPATVQEEMLGPGTYKMWKAGEIKLGDLKVTVKNKTWGNSYRVPGVNELRGKTGGTPPATRGGGPAPVKPPPPIPPESKKPDAKIEDFGIKLPDVLPKQRTEAQLLKLLGTDQMPDVKSLTTGELESIRQWFNAKLNEKQRYGNLVVDELGLRRYAEADPSGLRPFLSDQHFNLSKMEYSTVVGYRESIVEGVRVRAISGKLLQEELNLARDRLYDVDRIIDGSSGSTKPKTWREAVSARREAFDRRNDGIDRPKPNYMTSENGLANRLADKIELGRSKVYDAMIFTLPGVSSGAEMRKKIEEIVAEMHEGKTPRDAPKPSMVQAKVQMALYGPESDHIPRDAFKFKDEHGRVIHNVDPPHEAATQWLRRVVSKSVVGQYYAVDTTVKSSWIRAFAKKGPSGQPPHTTTISTSTDSGTVAHELGHTIEFSQEMAGQRCADFVKRRAAESGVTKTEKLSKLTGNSAYDKTEEAYDDKFHHPYVGKVYGDSSTEVISMGLERLYKDPIGFARNDPDYFDFVWSMIRP